MFSGIIEEKGIIKKIDFKKNLFVLTLEARKVHQGTKIGDSIAVDGVCLTVVQKKGRALSFDVMKETIEKTTLKYLKSGSPVNLERALQVNDRLGGHFVQGHIEGVGVIKDKVTLKNYVEFRISIDKKLIRYVVAKGSVCIDGISLTVGEVQGTTFSIYIIPHTLEVTTLGSKTRGDKVNIETDILARYILNELKR